MIQEIILADGPHVGVQTFANIETECIFYTRDRGEPKEDNKAVVHYSTESFLSDEEEKRLSEESKKSIEASKPFPEAIATPILPASMFYAAEGYHQDSYRKNPIRYKYYKWGCGRAQRLEELWGPADH